jgi:hypothetical protein
MAVKTNQYGPSGQDTSRGPSYAMWFAAPVEDAIQSFSGGIGTAGMLVEDDFILLGNLTVNAAGNLGRWATWTDTHAALAADPAQEGGVAEFTVGSNSGVNISVGSLAGAFRLITAATGNAAQQPLWFECRVAVGSFTASKRDIFIGLMDLGGTVNTATAGIWSGSDTFATAMNFIGFVGRGGATNATDWSFAYNVASGTVQRPTGMQTLVTSVTGTAPIVFTAGTNANATGFVKLGFLFDPRPSNVPLIISTAGPSQTVGTLAQPTLTVFVNGQPLSPFLTKTNVQAATFPTGWMSPQIGYRSASGTSPGDLYVDWIRCFQLASI